MCKINKLKERVYKRRRNETHARYSCWLCKPVLTHEMCTGIRVCACAPARLGVSRFAWIYTVLRVCGGSVLIVRLPQCWSFAWRNRLSARCGPYNPIHIHHIYLLPLTVFEMIFSLNYIIKCCSYSQARYSLCLSAFSANFYTPSFPSSVTLSHSVTIFRSRWWRLALPVFSLLLYHNCQYTDLNRSI